MIHFLVRHTTHYKYSARVTRCYNLANVIPRDTARQRCLKNRITLSPLPATTHKRTDYFGNKTFHFEIQKPHTELIITAESEVQITVKDQAMNLDLGVSYQRCAGIPGQGPQAGHHRSSRVFTELANDRMQRGAGRLRQAVLCQGPFTEVLCERTDHPYFQGV